MIKTIECPMCGHENEYDTDNDVLLCEECDEMIFVPDPPAPRLRRQPQEKK